MNDGDGFLAIWSDVGSDVETDYLHWLTREHVHERLAVPGFLAVRVFRARTVAMRRYFILYRLSDPAVVGSPDYLARLNDPTPWSRRIMPILENFSRGGGPRVLRAGSGSGGFVAPLPIEAAVREAIAGRARKIAELDRIVAVQLLEDDPDRSGIATREKTIRTGDRAFDALLLIEALDEDALGPAIAAAGVRPSLVYEQVFSLGAGEGA